RARQPTKNGKCARSRGYRAALDGDAPLYTLRVFEDAGSDCPDGSTRGTKIAQIQLLLPQIEHLEFGFPPYDKYIFFYGKQPNEIYRVAFDKAIFTDELCDVLWPRESSVERGPDGFPKVGVSDYSNELIDMMKVPESVVRTAPL